MDDSLVRRSVAVEIFWVHRASYENEVHIVCRSVANRPVPRSGPSAVAYRESMPYVPGVGDHRHTLNMLSLDYSRNPRQITYCVLWAGRRPAPTRISKRIVWPGVADPRPFYNCCRSRRDLTGYVLPFGAAT